MRTITRADAEAMQTASTYAADLYRLTLAACQQRAARHPNPDDLTADAMTVAAHFIPEDFRTGEAQPADANDAQRIANGAARRAVSRALARRHEDAREAASLDALAEADPGMVETLATTSASRYGTGCTGGATPDPAARWTERPTDAIAAALTVVDESRRATFATSVEDYLTAVSNPTGHRAPSLTGATAHATGQRPDSRTARAIRKATQEALTDVQTYAVALLAAPAERTTDARYDAAWMPAPSERRTHWTPKATATADAMTIRTRLAVRAANAEQAARPTAPTGSPIVTRTAYGYGAGLGYDRVTITDAETGATLATYDADHWTPAQTAAVLRHLTTHAPEAVATREGVSEEERRTGERIAATPAPGPVKKPSRRSKGGSGSTGPTVPAHRWTMGQ